jgi:flavin reductase (DIM6/NTAB) family NADH-FMN oxidoreductase RutF
MSFLVEAMDRTSDDVGSHEDEFDLADLSRREARTIDIPLVDAAKATMECTLHDTMEIGDHIVLFGRIRHITVDEQLVTDGKIDVEKVDAVGRLTGS